MTTLDIQQLVRALAVQIAETTVERDIANSQLQQAVEELAALQATIALEPVLSVDS